MTPRPLHIGDDNNGQPQFLTPLERTMGVQIIGSPGTGKSQQANRMLDQDERHLPGASLVIDPAGNHENSLYAQALARAVRYRPLRPTYFINLSQPRHIYGFNIFARREGGDISTRVQQCVRRLFTAWGEPDIYERPRLLYWSTGVFATGMHRGDVGLTELRLLLDHERAALRTHLTDETPVASRFRALNQKRPEQFEEQVEAVRNRLDALTSAAAPRRFLSLIYPPAMLDFRTVIAQRARVYVNLQESADLDRDHANVIGTLLAADFIEQACQRPNPGRAPVALYIDEAHRFISPDLASVFEEGRKFNVFTTLLHQHLDQLRQGQDERVLNAILSCARTKMVFALGSDRDAKELVHEIFVGKHGINYTEVKHVQPQTKFRPVGIREQSISRSRGGGATDTEGKSQGVSHTRTKGENESEGKTTGKSHTRGTSRTQTHTEGTGVTWTRARGIAESSGSTYSQAVGVATPDDPELLATTSFSTTDNDTQSTTTSRVKSRAFARTESDAESEGENESRSKSRSQTWTRGRTKSSADTDSATKNRSRGRNTTWAETTTDGPGVRHEEFREDKVEFFTFAEQEQRKADELRLPPQRGFVLRRADCQTAQLAVPLRTPLRYSARALLAHEARSAAKNGAVSCEEADTRINDRCRAIEEAAVVNLEEHRPPRIVPRAAPAPPYDESEPRKIAARKRIRPNPTLNPAKKPPEGSNGSEG